MTQIALQINEMVNHLPETDQQLVLEVIKRFIPDDVASSEDIIAINLARDEYARGETVNFNDADWG